MKTISVRATGDGNQATATVDAGNGVTLTLRGPRWEGEFANDRPAPTSNAWRGSPYSFLDSRGVRCDPLWWDR